MRLPRTAGIIGAVAGVAAAGLAIATAQRAAARRGKAIVDPYAREPFGQLAADEVILVTAPDGPDLYVEVVEPSDGVEVDAGFLTGSAQSAPEPTVVFVHGFCLDMGTFHFQRRELTSRGDYRLVFYDQPGHGRSGRMDAGEYELSALGDALRAVLDSTVADGPVVLVGHSMGGMTIMACAERHPALFADRVAGVVLLSTSGSLFGEAKKGPPALFARFARPLLPLVNSAVRLTGSVVDRARLAAADIAFLLTRRYGFGSAPVSPALVSYVERMNSRTPAETIAGYLHTLSTHERHPALAALRHLPTLVIVGDSDIITPLEHSEEIVRYLPDAQLLVVPDAGHLVMLEHPTVVNDALLRFCDRIGIDDGTA